MKRLNEEDRSIIHDNKRVKNQSENVLPDDVCYEVMKFLSTSYIIRKCFLISKQWYRVAITRCKFSVLIKDKEIFAQFIRSFVPNLEPFYPVFKLISFPYYKNIEKLSLDLIFYHEYLVEIGKNLPNLTSLKILKGDFVPFYLSVMEERNPMPNLKELRLCGNVGYSRVFSRLESISVSQFEDLHNLVKNAKNLTKFQCTALGGKQIKTLAALKELSSLGISCKANELNLIVDGFPHLTALKLVDCGIRDAHVKLLSKLKKLTSLDLSMNEIGPNGSIALSSLPQLTSLDVAECQIGLEGLKSICNSLTHLREFSVDGNSVGNEGAMLICSFLKKLYKLSMSNSELGDEGCKLIGKSLVDLEVLAIACNPIGDEGLMAIFTNLLKLKSLSLGDNHASYSTMQFIISQMPTGLNITILDP